MLSEEALIVLAALGAVGLLVLGVLELLWPTRPKHPVRRRVPVVVRGRGRAPRRRVRRYALLPGPAASVPRASRPSLAPPPSVESAPTAAPSSGAGAPAPERSARTGAPVEVAARPVVRESPVETCFALYQAKRYDEVVSVGLAALGDEGSARPENAVETAALWSVIALARQALGDDIGARAALEAAIATAPPPERPTYQRQLAVLALNVARTLLADVDRQTSTTSEQRIATIRAALAWLDAGQAAMPSDAALAEASAAAQAALWPAYEQVVTALAQRQEFAAARRLLREALADPRFPAARRETFRELLSGTFSGEVGQLTANAIRSMQDAREADALASLQRAEELLGTVEDDSLAPQRREEVDRRLWWGYNKLGARRLEAGEFEEALDPLLHALRFDAGPERLAETRAAVVRALEGVIDARALAIRELADAGDREAAIVQSERLRALVRSAEEARLGEPALAGAIAKMQRLLESLGRRREP